jgi:hypothetical protein
LIKEYKQNQPQAGIYQIRNLVNEKVLVGATLNLRGILNRHRFQLQMNSHPNPHWREFGAENFVFEILDELGPIEEPQEMRANLACLEDLWLEKLRPYGEQGHNEPKKKPGRKAMADRAQPCRAGLVAVANARWQFCQS